jgi:hypothetical protein
MLIVSFLFENNIIKKLFKKITQLKKNYKLA